MLRHFDQQLDKLKSRLIKMSGLVDEQVEFAIRAVEEGNAELAELVIERDSKVDKYDLKVDKICMKLLALNQPVAMDLRLIMSAMTINSNLERMGDLAADLAGNTKYFNPKPDFLDEIQFSRIASLSREMVRLSIDAFVESSAQVADKVLLLDDTLDELVKENSSRIIEIMKNRPQTIDQAIRLYSIYHSFERLGDYSTNIAEMVYFIVEAEMIKHRYEKFIRFGENSRIKENDERNME